MASYTGSGIVITKVSKKKFMLKITDKLDIYSPFLRLNHLKISESFDGSYLGMLDDSLTFTQLVRFAQIASSIEPAEFEIKESETQSHKVTQREMLALLQLLPSHFIHSLTRVVHSLNHNHGTSWAEVLMSSIPARTFGAALFQYLNVRSGFKEGDRITCEIGCDVLEWRQSRFVPIT